jgi:hypothetical protein
VKNGAGKLAWFDEDDNAVARTYLDGCQRLRTLTR